MDRKKDPIISLFVNSVKKHIPLSKIILFGSRAKKKALSTSDYDFLVISPIFRKLEWEKRCAKIYKMKRNIPAAMDIICLTPEEFNEKKKV